MNNNGIKQKYGLWIKYIDLEWQILLIYYLLTSLLFINVYQHQIDNDGISYISLAQKYMTGDFHNAINGYWSPLISWFIIPLLYLGVEPLLAFRIASIGIGIFTLAGIDKVLSELHVTRYIRILYLLSLSPVIAWSAEYDVGADLLGACLLVYYMYAVLRDKYQINKSAGFLPGFMGALAYLAKNYNFYFFLLHFTSVNFIYWANATDKQKKRTIAVNFLSAIVVFSLVSGVWIGLISNKYHKLTVSTAGGFSLSLVRPNSTGYPMHTDGFLTPPNATAVSAWEDPTYIKSVTWNPFSSDDDFRFFIKHILKNALKYLRGIAKNYIFILTIIYFIVTIFFLKRRLDKKVSYIILTILLYPLGYFFLYYDGLRHVRINIFLFYILSAYIIDGIFVKYQNNKIITVSISLILFVSLLALTLTRVNHDYKTNIFNDIYSTSNKLNKYYNMENKNIANQAGNWNYTCKLSFFLKARYFGMAKADITDEQLRMDLIANKIHYYLVYGKLKNNIDLLKQEKHFGTVAGDLAIYKVVPL